MKKNLVIVKKILNRFKDSVLTLSKHKKEKAITKTIDKYAKEILKSIIKKDINLKKKKSSEWNKDRIIEYFTKNKKENKK